MIYQNRPQRCESRIGKKIQPRLRLLGQTGEEHRDGVAVVTVAVTGNDDTSAINAPGILGGLQRDGHFSPRADGRIRAKFNTIAAHTHLVGRQRKAGLPGLYGYGR